jgi:hypothetical protein
MSNNGQMKDSECSMDLTVDESTIKSTTECGKGFACLDGDKNLLCKVEFSVRDETVFVRCLNIEHCFYRMIFGYLFVCNCPVRKEIYKRYQY